MPIDYRQLRGYLDGLVPKRPAEMQAMERYAAEHGFPIIGPAAGQLCYQLTRMTRARRVFEMGSGYGYSTAWFARAVAENGGGEVHHVVWDQALSDRARKHLAALGFDRLIRYHVGEAIAALEANEGPFDLIFNDIDKDAYPRSLEVINRRIAAGGLLIVDNMLWGGSVFDEGDDSADTRGIREFTRSITSDPAWIVSLAPIRDGLVIAYRK